MTEVYGKRHLAAELNRRIDAELAQFRRQVLARSRKEIYELGFRIQATERLGALLKERAGQMSEKTLGLLLMHQGRILELFFGEYGQTEDGAEAEMQRSIERTLHRLTEENSS